MSAGAFTTVAYRSTRQPTRVSPIKVQPETTGLSVTIAGAPVINQSGEALTAINNPTRVRVSGSRRRRGMKAGTIRFKFVDATTAPGNYLQNSVLSLPILNPALNAASDGATGTYLGAAITVVGETSPESGS